MAWWLATPTDGTARSAITRFDPRYWTVNFPRPMMAALTTPLTSNDRMRVDASFYKKGDLCGLIWESEDTRDHPLLRYQTQRDYRGCRISFRWRSDGVIPLDALNGPTLTIEGRDAQGLPKAWFVRLWNYANGTPVDSLITLDFSSLDGGFNLPAEKDPVFAGFIDRMFISLVPTGYIEGSDEPLLNPQDGWVEVSNMTVSGPRQTLAIGNSKVANHTMKVATGFDDLYNITPARMMRNIQWLGYRDSIVHYVGMSHYFKLKHDEDSGNYLVDVSAGNGLNASCVAWHKDFAARCKDLGYDLIVSLSYELLDQHCPPAWKQIDHSGQRALTGWDPPSSLLSPCNPDAMGYLQAIARNFTAISAQAGLPVKFQVGEPWWWVQFNGKICLYDDDTIAAWESSHGGSPPPLISDVHAEMTPDQTAYLDWAGTKLAASTAALRDAAINGHSGAETFILIYLPTILDNASPEVKRANVPLGWAKPAFDRLQLEDYDWVTQDTGKTAVGVTVAGERLGYPISEQNYFSGFVLLPEDKGQWSLIDEAAEASRVRGTEGTYFWALPQIMRDGFVHSDRGVYADAFSNGGVLWPVPPNWREGYQVTYEFRTDIFTSRSGREQRRAQRTTPRKTVNFTITRTGETKRAVNRLITDHQAKPVQMADLTRFTKLAAPATSGSRALAVAALGQNWLTPGRSVVIAGLDSYALVEIATINPDTGAIGLVDPLDRDWPIGAKLHPPLAGALDESIPVSNYGDRSIEADISFNAAPAANQPDEAGTPVANFNKREVFTYDPNFAQPVQGDFVRKPDIVDFGRGRISTYLPISYSTRTKQFQMLLRTQAERAALVGLFLRQKGQRGEFYMPSFEHDFEPAIPALAGSTSAVFKGTDLYDVFMVDRVHRAVMLKNASGVVAYRTITSASSDGTDTTLVTDTAWPFTINDTVQVTWLLVHRFAVDALTVECVSDEVSKVQLSVQTLEDLPVAGADAYLAGAFGGPTTAYLLDAPALSASDDDLGAYIVANTATNDWFEAQLFKSFDNGNSYSSFLHIGATSPIGTSATVLPAAPPHYSDYASTVDVTLLNPDSSLTGASKADVLNGANLAMLGGELIQFEQATLLEQGRYRLSGLTRGRYGTEDQIGTHVVGEKFALLSTDARVRTTLPAGDLNALRRYRAVTSGTDIADSVVFTFTLGGRSLRPYSPAHPTAERIGNAWYIRAIQRVRINGGWNSGADVPAENGLRSFFDVEILHPVTGAVKRTFAASGGLNVGTTVYGEAEQIEDFGAVQNSIRIRMYQSSTRYGRGTPTEFTA